MEQLIPEPAKREKPKHPDEWWADGRRVYRGAWDFIANATSHGEALHFVKKHNENLTPKDGQRQYRCR